MKNYSIIIIISLIILLLLGGIFHLYKTSSLQNKILVQEQTISSQDSKIKEQLTEINILKADLETKLASLNSLQLLNKKQQENNEILQANLRDLEEINNSCESKTVYVKVPTETKEVIKEEVDVVDSKTGLKYINMRNTLVQPYK